MWENVDIKLVKTEKGKNYLVSKPNYHTTKFFTEKLLAAKIKKQRSLLTNLSIKNIRYENISKTLMY